MGCPEPPSVISISELTHKHRNKEDMCDDDDSA
jgi:hypothetical protein